MQPHLLLFLSCLKMKLSTVYAALLPACASAAYCRYRIRAYGASDCSGPAMADGTGSSRDCFATNQEPFIWIDNLNGTDYCAGGNWIREYANILYPGTCRNNNRGQQNVDTGTCIRLQHYNVNAVHTDSIRINYQ